MSTNETPRTAPAELRWAMIHHQGVPVAMCPVAAVGPRKIQLRCGPLRFARNTRILLALSRERAPARTVVKAVGLVASQKEGDMEVRLLEPVPEELA